MGKGLLLASWLRQLPFASPRFIVPRGNKHRNLILRSPKLLLAKELVNVLRYVDLEDGKRYRHCGTGKMISREVRPACTANCKMQKPASRAGCT